MLTEVITPPAVPAAQPSRRRITRVRAEVSCLAQRFEAIVEGGDDDSAIVRLSQPAAVGDELQLRFQGTEGDRYARIRMRATVAEVMEARRRRYRLRVDLVTPPREWGDLSEMLGRVLDATDTGEWQIAE